MRRERWRSFAPYLALAVVTTLLMVWVLKLPMSRLDVPYTFSGDAIEKVTQIRNVAETGWLFHNDRLGYPFGYDRLDFPRFDSLNYAVMGPIAALTGQAGLAINLYFLAGFYLVGFAAYYCLRRLGLRIGPALTGALVYAFLPYHLSNGVLHLTNGAYFLVPLCMLVLVWLVQNHFDPDTPDVRRRWLFALAVALLIPLQTPYNGFFFALLCVIAGALAVAQRTHWRSALPALVLVCATGLAFITEFAPLLLHESTTGQASFAAARSAAEAKNMSLHLNQVLLPTAWDDIAAVAQAKRGFDHVMGMDAPYTEVSNQYIGAFGVLGFFALFWALARALRTPQVSNSATPELRLERVVAISAILAIAIVLVAITSGIGSIIAYFITAKIRAYNRILPFLAFPCILGGGWIVQTIEQRFTRRLSRILIIGLIGVLALWDVTVQPMYTRHATVVAEFDRDSAFFAQVEQRLGTGVAVFQLPVVWYPEHAPVNKMGDYEEFKPFLMTRTLRFSYGGAHGRAGYAWGRSLETQPPAELTAKLHQMGFGAILIDGRAYASDELRGTVEALTQLLPEHPSISADRRWWLFPLQGCCGGAPVVPIPPGEHPPAYAYDMRGPALDFSNHGTGWQSRDGGWADAEKWGNWSIGTDARLRLRLVPATQGPLLLTMTTYAMVGPNVPERHLRVVCNGTTVARVDYTRSTPDRRLSAPLPAGLIGREGLLEIRFEVSPRATPESAGVNVDRRPLGIGLSELAIAPANPDHHAD